MRCRWIIGNLSRKSVNSRVLLFCPETDFYMYSRQNGGWIMGLIMDLIPTIIPVHLITWITSHLAGTKRCFATDKGVWFAAAF
jgi:hypothetical protein